MEPNFGCTSPTLMRRAVKKLYGYWFTIIIIILII
jgi:hypothetical protein